MNPELVASQIEEFLVKRVRRVGATGGVIGLSGGIDSTCVAALAKKAFDKAGLELVGYILPSNVNNPEDEKDAMVFAKKLGIKYEVISIEPIVEAYKITNKESFLNHFDKGNLMSRIRANILNAKAATENKIVLGTGNHEEDYVLGYYTLFGDGAVHCSPIANLPKRLVKEMLVHLGFGECANRIATAGLELGQTDFRDLGYSYDVAELVEEGIKLGFEINQLVENFQILEFVERDIEAYKKEYGRAKFETAREIVEDILKRKDGANRKAEIIHPPSAKITLNYGEEYD